MAFWHNQSALICLGSAVLSMVIAYLLLRPCRRQHFLGRLPLFLVTGSAFLFVAIATLPEAAPHFFERFLGHSLSDTVVRQLSGGVTVSENWLTFWGESVGTVFRLVILVSFLWAIVNLGPKDSHTVECTYAHDKRWVGRYLRLGFNGSRSALIGKPMSALNC